MTGVLRRTGEFTGMHTNTQRERHVTPEAKMSDAAVSQGMLRVSQYHGKLAKLKEAFYPEFQREHGLTDTLNLHFQFIKL